MKKLSNLKSVKALSKKEQQNINGGKAPVCPYPLQPVLYFGPFGPYWVCE